MKKTYRRGAVGAWLVAAMSAPCPDARGCGFHGLLPDGFGASHPRSLDVAFAVRDAVAAGVMDESAVASRLSGPAGYARANLRMGALRRRLAAADRAAAAPAVSVLLVDSNLWTRLVPGARGYEMSAHAPGPTEGDAIVVTHEAVLAAVLGRRLASDVAFDRGLLIVDGQPSAAGHVRRLLVQSLPRPATNSGSGSGGTAAPARQG